jgi:ferredoxin/flavodoxin---NADP+ reductase
MSFHSTSAAAAAGEESRFTPAAGQVAIVGCGPTGCYTALALLRLAPDVRITVFDARPTPFGLVRYGVAPDHQGMKNVSKQFDRLFASEQVEFVGNTVVGKDLQLSALEENFDVVVVATGLPQDRRLTVPVDPKARVFGAGQLLRLLNGDPDSSLRNTDPPAPLGADVLVVGAGNVAMDVARLLCKGDEGFHGSDVDDEAREALNTPELRRLTLLSRGPRDRVRWDAAMFAELCALPNVSVYLDGEIDERSLHASDGTSHDRTVRVDVRFNEIPVGIDVDVERSIVRTRANPPRQRVEPGAEYDEFTYRVDSVVTAMGFVEPSDVPASAVGDGVLRVGGCSSGTLGNLAENRALAKTAAQEIINRLQHGRGRPGLAGVREFCTSATSFDDWTSIDRAETMRARPNRLRTKLTSWSAMSEVIAEHRRTATGQRGANTAADQ